MTILTRGPYSMSMADDGAVLVKPHDWLSKYSIVLYNNFWRILEFARRGGDGRFHPIADVNRIYAGETLYHLPTYLRRVPPIMVMPEVAIDVSSGVPVARPTAGTPDSVKRKITLDALKAKYDFSGEHLALLNTIMDHLGYADTGLTLMEIAGLLAEGGFLATVGTGLSIGSIFMTGAGVIIATLNALEAGEREFGVIAVIYTITAWAFDDTPFPPPPSESALARLKSAKWITEAEIAPYRAAWIRAATSAKDGLVALVAKEKLPKRDLQEPVKALGGYDRKNLASVLWKDFQKEFDSTSAKRIFRGIPIEYPR